MDQHLNLIHMLEIFAIFHLLLSKTMEFMTVLLFLFSKRLQKAVFYNWWDIQRFSCPKWSISPNTFFGETSNTIYIYFLTLFTKTKPLEQIQRYGGASLSGQKNLFTSSKIVFNCVELCRKFFEQISIKLKILKIFVRSFS